MSLRDNVVGALYFSFFVLIVGFVVASSPTLTITDTGFKSDSDITFNVSVIPTLSNTLNLGNGSNIWRAVTVARVELGAGDASYIDWKNDTSKDFDFRLFYAETNDLFTLRNRSNNNIWTINQSGRMDMFNHPISNIGDAGTDFTSTGGLTLADVLSITPRTTAPASCTEGEVYTDDSGAFCYCYTANTWENLGANGACA